MSDERKWTRRAAIGFLGTGAGLFALNTGAATQIYADRSIGLGTTDDPEALLPLIDESENAEVSNSANATIYRIEGTDLHWKFTNATITKINDGDSELSQVNGIELLRQNSSLGVGCSGRGVIGDFKLVLDLEAKAEGQTAPLSVTTERMTDSFVSVDCPTDYSESSNYSDNEAGKASQPGDDARGEIKNPANINDGNDDTFSILQSRNDDDGLEVGFSLPILPSADEYVLSVNVEKATGDLKVYIVNEAGKKLSCELDLKAEDLEFTIQDDNECNGERTISDNRANIFLIFEGGSNGNNPSEIISFDLRAN